MYYNHVKDKQLWFVNGFILNKAPPFTSDPPTNYYCRYDSSPCGAEISECMTNSKTHIKLDAR